MILMSLSLPIIDCVWGAEAALVFVRESKYWKFGIYGEPKGEADRINICDKRKLLTQVPKSSYFIQKHKYQ